MPLFSYFEYKLIYAVTFIFCYLLGSIPSGYIIPKVVRGIDIREHGSGNIGATNVARVMGIGYFFVVFFLDAIKGFIPVFIIAPFVANTWRCPV